MVEVIKFADDEAFTVSFLRTEFAARGIIAGVGTQFPKTTPSSFVRVSRSGGSARDLVTDSATQLIECFGPDTVAASDLARVARALMLASGRLSDKVTRAVDGGGIAFLPDPDTNKPRYQFVVQLDIRGNTI
jgi:hypothetical protein